MRKKQNGAFLACLALLTASIPATLQAQEQKVPYNIDVRDETVVQRSFRNYDDHVLCYVISVGSPQGVHFAINTFNGTINEVWRGAFLDAGPMWVYKGRGIGIAEPRETVVKLNNEKAFARLSDFKTFWGDSLSASEYQFLGYDVDKQNIPTFRYVFAGHTIEDRTMPKDNKFLTRSLHFDQPAAEKIYFRLGSGKIIKRIKKGWYNIDDSHQIRIPAKSKVTIQDNGNKQLLLVELKNDFQYDIIW